MKPGDIGFVMHKKNWISKTIAWFMSSRWSHTFMIYDIGQYGIYIIETTDFEVTISPLTKYLTDRTCDVEIFKADISEDEQRDIILGSGPLIGTIYGYLQLLSLGIRRILKRVGIHIGNFLRVGVVCNHVPLYGYTRTKIERLGGIDPESIDTEELYQIISKHEKFKLIYTQESQ